MYGTIENLKDSFGSKKDLLLQDITDEQLTMMLEDQSSYIDSFLQVRYQLPLPGSNAIINRLCIILSKAECYRLFASNDIPEAVKEQEKQALKDLVKIQKGQILIMKEDTLEDDITSKEVYFGDWL
jgi:phage gp36-like protein